MATLQYSLNPKSFKLTSNNDAIIYPIYIETVLYRIEKRTDIPKPIRDILTALFESLVNNGKQSDRAKVKQLVKKAKPLFNQDVKNAINKEFGEVLGPVIAVKNIKRIKPNEVFVAFPNSVNQSTYDFSIWRSDWKRPVEQLFSSKIIAKKGRRVNTVKPKEIIEMFIRGERQVPEKAKPMYRELKKSLEFSIIQLLHEFSAFEGPLMVRLTLPKLFGAIQEFKKGNVSMSLRAQKKITEITSRNKGMRQTFGAILNFALYRENVSMVKFALENSGEYAVDFIPANLKMDDPPESFLEGKGKNESGGIGSKMGLTPP